MSNILGNKQGLKKSLSLSACLWERGRRRERESEKSSLAAVQPDDHYQKHQQRSLVRGAASAGVRSNTDPTVRCRSLSVRLSLYVCGGRRGGAGVSLSRLPPGAAQHTLLEALEQLNNCFSNIAISWVTGHGCIGLLVGLRYSTHWFVHLG